jgi:mannitol-specific phosphotransferase system IIBC component
MASVDGKTIQNVVVACEAGVGSSVLLTSQLSQRLKKYGVKVTHKPVNSLTDGTADVVLCHKGLAGRARQAAPNTPVLAFNMFLGDPAFDRLEQAVRDGGTLEA